jgi:peptide/nickel transport system substrate-binding protein
MDRDAIVKAAYNGYADVADALVPATSSDYTKPTTIYSRDVAKAKQLLADAGYADGVSFEVLVPSTDPVFSAACQLIQAQVKEAGITITLRPGDATSLSQLWIKGDYQSTYTQSSPAALGSADSEFIYRWSYYGAGGFVELGPHWFGDQRKQIEGLLDQAATAATDAEYKDFIGQVINLVAEFGPVKPIVHPKQIYAWNTKSTAAITPSPVGAVILAQGL